MTTNTISKIGQVFQTLQAENKLAFMPFVTAGDPDIPGTERLLETLANSGADLIELGFPYSDPVADGPVIQASYTRALNQHLGVHDIFAMLEKLDHEAFPPIVAMVSYAIIYRFGIEKFVKQASGAGFSGFIVPDLPTNEASELLPVMQKEGLDLIQLLAPTTTHERTASIVENSTGFIYCIAVAGITGVREKVAEELIEQLRWLKTQTKTPLAVGFGISKPEHVKPLRDVADGVIAGSALVKYLQQVADKKLTFDEALKQIAQFTRQMSDAAH